jgi:hypothetical protein
MIHALTVKNKVGFINGTIQPPLETEQPTEYALWNRCNSMIKSYQCRIDIVMNLLVSASLSCNNIYTEKHQ